MILDTTINAYDIDMMGRFTELVERYDGGQLNAEEYAESLKNDFPDQGKSCFRMGLNEINKITFGMANNCYTKTLGKERVFQTGCLAINGNGQI